MSKSNAEVFGSEGQWCILELMGHRRLAGLVSEVKIAGQGFLQIDIPDLDPDNWTTQFYAPSSVYGITPTTEEIATTVATQSASRPVHTWELRALDAGEPDWEDDDIDDDELSEGPF